MHDQPSLDTLWAALERDPRLAGKRVHQIPVLADFRRKYRWRFYRLADAGLVLLIWNVAAALNATWPTWGFALISAGLNIAMILVGESRARLLSRQLNRSAPEQVARDLLGIVN